MTDQNQLPEEPVRSKGEATLLLDGYAELPANIRDVSLSGIGVIASRHVGPGAQVRILTHGHAASGVVQSCQPEGERFYLAIALDPAAP